MAKQLLRTYVFTPGSAGAGTITIPGNWKMDQLLVITNTTKNTVLYNFASPTYTGTSVSFSRANSASFPNTLLNSDGVTTVTLGISTVGMASTDTLQIYAERADGVVFTRSYGPGTDAWERQRVSTPQSMLDADFEYGLQPTKWQQISTLRNYPGIYEVPGSDLPLGTITTDASGGGAAAQSIESLITVTSSVPHNLTTGTAITVSGLDSTVSSYSRAQGSFIVNSVPTTQSLTYYAKGRVGVNNGDTVSASFSVVRRGGFYTGSARNDVTFSTSGSGASTTGTVTVTFATNHGLLPGNTIIATVNSDNGSNNHTLCQGPFFVTAVPSATTISYSARNVGSISGTPTGSIYARSDAFYVHRPFDGGVQLGTGSTAYGASAVRMSKKYIRYQSGKAINYNTGLLLAPNYVIRSVTAGGTSIGSTITIVCDDTDHGLQPGSYINLSGVSSNGYNGNYYVASVVDERTFTVLATSLLGATSAVLGTPCLVSLVNWYGSTVRAGTFDDQNGMFWQYDGIQIALGQRVATMNMGGTVSMTIGSGLVTGVNTRFQDQLIAGDKVVIRGLTHQITQVVSQTSMYVTPQWRGAINATATKMTKVIDKLYPQSTWNIDRCDGSNGVFNPSGYNINVSKMQMVGLQWTWYGAGFIDWMLRGADGNYITVHRQRNSNNNNEAYMRSGNMPVRYEVINEGSRSTLTNTIAAIDTVMTVTDATYFPQASATYPAFVFVDNELISYTSLTTSTGTLSGLTRNATLTQFAGGQNRSFTGAAAATHSSGTGVILVGQNATPNVSHWGSAFITDGGFDNDRGYIFNYQATNISVSTKKTTAFAIRLAPSVSNAITGDLGVRDLINRAQLLLSSIEITSGGGATSNSALVIEGILNPSNYPSTPTNITWNSLNSPAIPTGQPSFSQVAAGTSITFDNTATVITTANANSNSGTFILTVSTASIAVGDAVVNTTNNLSLAGGTTVQSIGSGNVTLNTTVINRVFNGDTLTFYRNSYAAPGETIFSFISAPANKDSLDLSSLKELTNTPLGGRNAYPNGPDVLMVNVYLTQGTPINTNLVLRWGEAQA
jgi:hypothetical protein